MYTQEITWYNWHKGQKNIYYALGGFYMDNNIKNKLKKIKSYLEKFDSLEELSMVSCNLNSLNNFPELPNLLKIDLSDNHLKDADLKELLRQLVLKIYKFFPSIRSHV